MKWFKHYSDASSNDSINRLEQQFGYEGYGVYWKLVEKCAAKWDGISEPVFTLNKVRTRLELRLKSVKTQSIMSLISVLKLADITETEFDYVIKLPKLREIKDNRTKDLQVESKGLASNLPLDKIRLDKDKKKNINPVPAGDCIAWIEAFNDAANTNFKGSAQILEQIKRHIKSGMTLDDARLVVEHKKTQWFTDEKMGKYFRPATLFGGKFANYLDDAKNSGALELESRLNELRQEFGI